MTTTEFNIEARWPELFEQLDENQRRAVMQSLAAAWHEGWEPNREDVESLTDEARGAIDAAEYRRRAYAAVRRRTFAGALMSFDTWEAYFYPPPDEGTLRNVDDIRAWELRTRARFARARVQARGSAGVP